MVPKRNFEAQLSAIDQLREATPQAAEPAVAQALTHRNNLLVARGAAIALHHRLTGLTPNLAGAFARFLEDGAKRDPQCWAKNAIAKALASFEYQEPELFLAGMRHIQPEASWGPPVDSAGMLRGTCALALVQCRELNSHRVLGYLVPLLADKELSVRVNAVRAIEQVGTDSAALLLRMRGELGSDDAEVLGCCYSGVLNLEGAAAIPWVAKFMSEEDDTAAEAAMAIALTHTAEAVGLLRDAFQTAVDGWFRSALLSAIALTRQQDATDWLIELIADETPHSKDAHEALCRSAPSEATLERLRQLGVSCRST
jgi:HEAT repeat protein